MQDGTMTPKELVEMGLAERPNIIFDIDHTLVHSVEMSHVTKDVPPNKGSSQNLVVGKIQNTDRYK